MIPEIVANVEPLFKQWYAKTVENLMYRDRPVLGMLAKENAGGEQIKQAIKIGQGAGQSSTFANALANMSLATRKPFLLDWGKDFSLCEVDNTLIQLSSNSKGAVLKVLVDEVETSMDAITQRTERDFFRAGFGYCGEIASGQGTPTITLTQRSDTQNFFESQVLVAAADENSGALRNAGATIVVTGVDRDAGTVTAAGNWTASIAALAANDVLFQQGDREDAATPTVRRIVGFGGWLPTTAPGGTDSFFGVNRSTNPTALAGVRVSAVGSPISQAIYNLAVRIGENGGSPDIAFCSFDAFGQLATEYEGKTNYDTVKGEGIDIYYSAFTVNGPKGPIKVFPDTYCPMERLYVLTKRDWTIYCGMGTNPIFPALHNGLMDVATKDSVQDRHKLLAQLGCAAPGRSGVALLA